MTYSQLFQDVNQPDLLGFALCPISV